MFDQHNTFTTLNVQNIFNCDTTQSLAHLATDLKDKTAPAPLSWMGFVGEQHSLSETTDSQSDSISESFQ